MAMGIGMAMGIDGWMEWCFSFSFLFFFLIRNWGEGQKAMLPLFVTLSSPIILFGRWLVGWSIGYPLPSPPPSTFSSSFFTSLLVVLNS